MAENFRLMWNDVGTMVLAALAMPFGVLVLFAIAGNLVQHRLVLSAEQLKPKLSKISLIAGWKRLFSSDQSWSISPRVSPSSSLSVRSCSIIAWPERDRLDVMMTCGSRHAADDGQGPAVKMLGGVIAILTVIAGLDLHLSAPYMASETAHEHEGVRDEYKQMEGDPTVKAQAAAAAHGARPQAHDGQRAGSHGGDHQPDPLCGGPEI